MPTDASWRLKILEAICERTRLGLPGTDPRPAAGGARLPALRATRTRRSSSATATSAARTRTTPRSRASSRTSSGAIRETDSEYIQTELEKYMVTQAVPDLRREAAAPRDPRGHDRRPEHLGRLDAVDHGRARLGDRSRPKRSTERERTIAYQVLKEIVARLGFLVDVGLDYLTLDRTSVTLSGGEAQRIRLATQIGTTLMGVLYILDEPSIGLHQRDNAKLIATLTRLRDLGNTVLVVEHDEETIRTADWVIDIGPGAGEHGGEIIANGSARSGARGAALDHRRLPARRAVRPDARSAAGAATGRRSSVNGAREHNLQEHRPAVPARDVHRGHRRVGQRQEHARHRGPVPRAGPRAQRLARAGRRPRPARGRAPRRQDHRDRPEPDRPHAALQPGDVHRAVRPDPRAVRRRPRGPRPRLHAGPVQLQRQGRPLRELQGRRDPQDRDAVPARRLRHRARSARASATTARRSRSTTRAARSPTCSR